jgi:hypothetical protein
MNRICPVPCSMYKWRKSSPPKDEHRKTSFQDMLRQYRILAGTIGIMGF